MEQQLYIGDSVLLRDDPQQLVRTIVGFKNESWFGSILPVKEQRYVMIEWVNRSDGTIGFGICPEYEVFKCANTSIRFSPVNGVSAD